MLRDYQLRTIDQLRAVVHQGSRSVCVVMPTGAGKTRTLGEVARLRVGNGGRVLWLAHRGELVDQAVDALTSMGLAPGAISASASAGPRPFAPVQVATVQTLLRRNIRPPADLIVADEAHHYVADTFGALVRSYPPNTLIFGPTATPERSDGIGLGAMFRNMVVGVRVRELVDAGHLVPAVVIAPREKLRSYQIAQRPVDAYLQHARGRRAIVFSPSVAIAEEHSMQFAAAGFTSRVVSGDTPWAERRACFAGLRTGELQVLVNVYVATEGFDVPEIDCVILARGFGSAGTYLQCVGRALRPAAGKRDALVLDLTGTSHVHGHPEDDRQYSLDGRGIRKGDDAQVVQSYCRVCGAPGIAGQACEECGTAPRETNLTVTGEPLIPYGRKRQETPDQRVATLRRWLTVASDKGYKPSWALFKYKAVYGGWPPTEIRALATGAA